MKQKGNWDDKRPDTGEKLSGRFSIHSGGGGLGGSPDFTTADFAAAVGSIEDTLQRIVVGARYGNWPSDREQLREIVVRRSWSSWRENHRDGNMSATLNIKIADLVLADWYLMAEYRRRIGDTTRAKRLGVDPRRYKTRLKTHHLDLVCWLDMVATEALIKVRKQLRK